MREKAVIFDLDGTLHNRKQSLYLFLTSQYRTLLESHVNFSFDQFRSEFTKLDKNGHVWKDIVYEQLINSLGVNHIGADELLQNYINDFPTFSVLFDDTLNMLSWLKQEGYKLGMITNGKKVFQRNTILSLQLEEYFDHIIISEEVGLRKPDERIFDLSLTSLGVQACDSIFVGDHPIDDVEAAKKVGLMTIWCENPNWGSADAHKRCASISELPSLILELFDQNG
ncbi:HAD family hydrolase [Bacillus salitolerans]|uniref:HAD family hydrolase n=1 Tax=Bacillus salitolerans TaxID=1437434 RepID=A0ABW4LQV1_9BACI